MKLFNDLPISTDVKSVLETLQYTTPTEIQLKAIPEILAHDAIDVHGQAQTGTGKTLAFGIPALERVDVTRKETQILTVAPTRELALQICTELAPFARKMGITVTAVFGGASITDQIRSLKRGAHIVVGTPGRLIDHINRGTLKLDNLKTLILDEADTMLEMGFREDVEKIMENMNNDREIWLFSATVKPGIKTLIREHMNNPLYFKSKDKNVGTKNTEQFFCNLPSRARFGALCSFIECAPEFYGFIFCQTKLLTAEIAERLVKRGYSAGALHGDMSQAQRNLTIKRLKERKISILVATDVAARGIDISGLTHVVNYSLPDDLESYVHRVGRTGRAGNYGTAITFINRRETRLISVLEKKFSVTIAPIEIPTQDTIIQSRLKKAQVYLNEIHEDKAQENIDKNVDTLVNELSEDQVRSILRGIIHDKFLATIIEDSAQATQESDRYSKFNPDTQEVMLAVGTDDNLSEEDVIKFLLQTKAINRNDIKKIRVIKRRSFIHVPEKCMGALMSKLRNTTLGGRKTFAKVSRDDGPSFDRRPRRSRQPRRRSR